MTGEGADDAAVTDEAPRHGRRTRGPVAVIVDVVVALVLPAAIVAAVFLGPFLRDPSAMPFGSDTAGYIGRVTIVHDLGLRALEGLPHSLSSRPAYPVLLSVLRDLTGTTSLELAWLMPAVLAVAIALAAGAFAIAGLDEPRRRAVFFAVGVGASGAVAWTATAYATNLLIDPIAIAIVLAAILVAIERRPRSAGVLLAIGATLSHWMFAIVAGGLVLVFGLSLIVGRHLPVSMRPPRDAAARVLGMVGVAVVASFAAVGLAPGVTERLDPHVDPNGVRPNMRVPERLAAMALPLTIPASALAGFLGLREGSLRRRWATIALLWWALLAPAGLLAWYAFDVHLPPYRSSGFTLALPLLAVLAVGAIATLLRRWMGATGAVLGVGLLVAATAGLAIAGATVWNRQVSDLTSAEIAQYETANAYMDTLAGDPPIVLTTPLGRVRPTRVWAGLSASTIMRVSLLPTRVDRGVPGMGIALPPGAVVLGLAALDPRSTAYPGIRLSPEVVVLQGPAPTVPVAAGQPPQAPSPLRAAVLVTGILLVLGVAGSGWAGLLTDDGVARAALAPTFGAAIVGSLGTLTGRLGTPFGIGTSVALVSATLILGWLAHVGYRRRRPIEPLEP